MWWDGWMASLTQWTWVWVNSKSCWWTGRPGMLQSMGSQRVRRDWATELNWLCQTWDSQRCELNGSCFQPLNQALGQEDPQEKAMVTHSSILAWEIPCTEQPSRLQSMRSQSRTRLSDLARMPGLRCSLWDPQLWHAGSSSLAKDWTRAPCFRSLES